MNSHILKILSDSDVSLFIDEKYNCEVCRGITKFLSIPRGEYILDFISKIEPSIKERIEVDLCYDRIIHIEFQSRLKSSQAVINKMHLVPEMGPNGLFGYRDRLTGILMIPFQYESASRHYYVVTEDENAYAEVILGGKKRVINKSGAFIVDYDYSYIISNLDFTIDLDYVGDIYKKNICFLIETIHHKYLTDGKGNILGSFPADYFVNLKEHVFSNGVLISRMGLWQFIDYSGKQMVLAESIHKICSWFLNEGRNALFFVIENEGYYGIVGPNGQIYVPCNNADMKHIIYETSEVFLFYKSWSTDEKQRFTFEFFDDADRGALLCKQVFEESSYPREPRWKSIEETRIMKDGTSIIKTQRELEIEETIAYLSLEFPSHS